MSREFFNAQPALPLNRRDDGTLAVHSVWPTIQGEGPSQGTRATFVRLFGCNLECPLCDTDYTSNKTDYDPSRLVDLVSQTETCKGDLVVITGGEPLRQNLVPFLKLLAFTGRRVEIETNGSVGLPRFNARLAILICSPKTPTINPVVARHVDAYKYVVEQGNVDAEDGLPTSVLGNNLRPARPHKDFRGPVYVQPLDAMDEAKNEANRAQAVETCLRFGYKLHAQLHKGFGLP